MPEIALHMHLFVNNNIVMRPLSNIGRGEDYDRDNSFVKKYNLGLLDIFKTVITPIYEDSGQLLQDRYLSLMFKHLLKPSRPFMCETTPCGAGRNISIVAPDGNVYACNQSLGDKDFLLGNLEEDSYLNMKNNNIASSLSERKVENIEECKDFAISSWCGSPCAYEASKEFGSLMSKSRECRLMKDRYTRTLRGLINDEYELSVISKILNLDEIRKKYTDTKKEQL